MIGLMKKKKMQEITENTQSEGLIKLKREMPEIIRDLPINVPQARLIKEKNKI